MCWIYRWWQGAIIGARLGVSDWNENNAEVFQLELDDSDRDAIEQVGDRSSNLFQVIGDCGSEYRRQRLVA